MTEPLATRTFDAADQSTFSAFSGDANPIHMDALLARRTQAGTSVVHGIHVLLWLLDLVGTLRAEFPPVCRIEAQFKRMVHVGETVEARVTQFTDSTLCAEVSVQGAIAVELVLRFGRPVTTRVIDVAGDRALMRPKRPQELMITQIAGRSGYLAFASNAGEARKLFPTAAGALGAQRVAALACSTYLVGMTVPGLHSIFSGLSLDLCDPGDSLDRMAFRVTRTDARFGIVRLEVEGGGIVGTLETFVRKPPVLQPTIKTLAPLVSATEFAGATALVVGGSRGLGELTAKLVAAGGASVILTYAVGKTEAETVAAEITASGRAAAALQLEVPNGVDAFFASLKTPPTHIYYFATPMIFLPKINGISMERFEHFNRFYVSGFLETVAAACRSRPEGVRIFYPSSVAITDPQAGMAEYAMSKAAGEQLCDHINLKMPGAFVFRQRLPRLATDQTSTVVPVGTTDAVDVMLPIIRALQGSSRPS